MSKTILFEGQNLRLSAGTGITTYARTLGRIARELGYTTDVVLGVDGPLNARDEELREIAFYDAVNVHGPTRAHKLKIKAIEIFGAPFGVRPVRIHRRGVAIDISTDNLAGFDTVHAATSVTEVARLHFMRWGTRLKLKVSSQPDLLQTTQATPLQVSGCPNIYTVHDIVPLRVPETTLDIKRYFLDLIRHLGRHADHIVTVSEFSRADIMKLTGISGARITNTYQAVDLPAPLLARPENDVAIDLDRGFGLGFKEYFLFIGALEPKKNLSRLIEAYAASGTKRPLVIVGKLGWQYEDILKRINDERFYRLKPDGAHFVVDRRVRYLDYVPLAQLIALLRGARAFLFPSIYEGFGLPVLEAMTAGAPVLTSNSTSLSEIAADAALTITPYDVDAMSDGIRRLDDDADLRTELARRGSLRAAMFSKEKYAERVMDLYRRIM